MTMVVVWVLLCLIPAAVAHSKERGGLNMFLVSLVLSPLIGLIWALAMKPQSRRDEEAAREGSSRTHRVCPACSETVRRDAKVCKHCGRELPPPPELPRVPDAVVGWAIIAIVVLVLVQCSR